MSGVTRNRRTRRSAPATLAALALVAVIAACDGGDDPEPEPGGTGTSGPSEPGTTEPTEPTGPTEPTEPTEPAEPETPLGTGVAPADGRRVTVDGLSLSLPQGWKLDSQDAESFIASPREYNLDFLTVTSIQNDGRTSSPAQTFRDYLRYEQRPPQLSAPVEIDGVPMFYASGKVQRSTWVEAFGSDTTAYTIWITFDQSPQLKTLKERRELADSVMATVDLS